ncbi:histidine phosphatase family protein [Roseiterribacter gracilis]|uniref:Phosphoglycerate mutase n=1 Tax=Roseiterribacter gracilis TaxID=2812848 RepID=A0A8S8XE94_9PROT|nr:phosphoglycerate mutase [Rhodospirillales bacterium TMPK1]
MAIFHLLRHGQHDLLKHTLTGRTPGVTMNETGRAETARAAAWLATRALVALVASPLDRTREAARIVAAATNLQPTHDERLLEIDYGTFAGQRFDVLHQDPAWLNWTQNRAITRTPTGETMLEVQARYVSCLIDLRDLYGADEEIAVIGHGDPIGATLAYFLGAPIDVRRRIEIDNGSISTLRLALDSVTVQRVNFMP